MRIRYVGEYEEVTIVKDFILGTVKRGEEIEIENEQIAEELINTNKFEEVI